MKKIGWIHEGDASNLPMSTYRGTMADVRRARRAGRPVRFTPIEE